MATSILKEKSYLFAIRVVKLNQHLCHEKNEYVLSKQLLRSGTANWSVDQRGRIRTVKGRLSKQDVYLVKRSE